MELKPLKITYHESTLRLYLVKDPTGHAVIAHYRPKHLRMLYGKDIDITYLGLAAPALKPALILRTYTK